MGNIKIGSRYAQWVGVKDSIIPSLLATTSFELVVKTGAADNQQLALAFY
jgi:hypothetical protein